MKTHRKEPGIASRIIYFIASWLLILLIAIISAALIYGAIDRLQADQSIATATYLIVYILLIIIFTQVFVLLKPFKKNHFVRYGRWALGVGVSLMTLFGCIGLVSLEFNNRAESAAVDGMSCTNLSDQLTKATSAIRPIATDLGEGTAFAIDNKGTLLTAYHVIKGAKRVYLNYVSGEKNLKVIKTAPEYDLALLKSPEKSGTYLDLTSNYHVADELYAVGYPRNGLSAGGPSVSTGILSRILTNSDLKLNDKRAPNGLEMVQTDTALNPGNSGGPLINKCGAIGVVSAKSDSLQFGEYGISSEEGISYAISSVTVVQRFNLKLQE